MSPDEVADHLCVAFDDFADRAMRGEAPANWNGLRAELLSWIATIDTATAFLGLFQVLEKQTRYQYQWLAGDLLHGAAIPCPLNLDDFIHRVVPGFDSGADTVPKYLGTVFGRETVLRRLREMRLELRSADHIAAIDGMRYGLGEHPGTS